MFIHYPWFLLTNKKAVRLPLVIGGMDVKSACSHAEKSPSFVKPQLVFSTEN